MNGKRWAALGIAVALLFFSIIVNVTTSALFSNEESELLSDFFAMSDESFVEEIMEEGSGLDKIAVLSVEGTILADNTSSLIGSDGYDHESFLSQLDYAAEDEAVAGIVIYVNTPGGGVVESRQIYDKIQQIKQETEKPIYISMGGMAASGGYYISAPADKIFALEETWTGSLGVIMSSINYSKLLENIGVESVTIKSGEYKDIMSSSRDMTEEELKIMQALNDNAYNRFVQVIAKGRGMTEERVRQIADGRIYDGIQAKQIGLIDEFGYLGDVTNAMKMDLGIEDAQVVRYSAVGEFNFSQFFSATYQKLSGESSELSELMKTFTQSNSPRLMYLYTE